MHPSRVSLLASGTTANEALHSEMKNAFRQTIRLHQSTMATKLRIFHFGKLLTFTAARYRPTSRQMCPGHVMARALAGDVFVQANWMLLCEERQQSRPLPKSTTKLQARRLSR